MIYDIFSYFVKLLVLGYFTVFHLRLFHLFFNACGTWHTPMFAGIRFLTLPRLRHYPMRGHQHLYVHVSMLQHIPSHHDNNKNNRMLVISPINTTVAIKLIVILLRTVIIFMQVVVTFMCLLCVKPAFESVLRIA